jgi:FAD/FMN-containing dehydrogenase
MKLSGWGRYPWIESDVVLPRSFSECHQTIRNGGGFIARGLGRSYGDSSLAPGVLDTRYLDHFLAFDPEEGILCCAAGVSLDAVLREFVPRGWFLPVVPGTRFVTVGGAVASDVHGKNHHCHGSFTDHVTELRILLGNGETVTASPTENPDLFRATCGGMGLTGVILSAAFRMIPIRSTWIRQTVIRARNLEEILFALESAANATYTVAWIDCLAQGRHLGRSVLMSGEHAEIRDLRFSGKQPIPLPTDLPAGLISTATIRAFNTLYYHRARPGTSLVPLTSFFFPLDAIGNWNRAYGKPGFLQYQVVLPRSGGIRGLEVILEAIARSGYGSPLAVLKIFGPGNGRYLSFPMEGYTLALDFPASPETLRLLDRLDEKVLKTEGRLYLTKDARMSPELFQAGYPEWRRFQSVRERYHAGNRFASLQSIRLGLT